MKKRFIKISAVMLAVLMLLTTFLIPATAVETVPDDIETSDVMSDLKAMGIDVTKYQKDSSADHIRLLKFLEFGYDYNGDQSEYGLYIYVWNPTGKAINTDSALNKITIQSRSVSNVEQSDWRKLPLEFLDVSDDQGYQNVFYKFRIRASGASFLRQNLSKSLRVYEISEIELHQSGNTNATSFAVGGRFTFTGYQPYHNSLKNATNSLSCSATDRTVIEIEINPTTWKTDTSAKGIGYANELFSVYFAIPNDIIRDYGNPADETTKGLVQIDGTFDRHMINGIVTADQEVYDMVEPYLGVSTPSDDVPFWFASAVDFVLGSPESPDYYYYRDPFNVDPDSYNVYTYGIGNRYDIYISELTSIFLSNISEKDDFISASVLKDTLYSLWKDHGELYFERSPNFVNSTGRIFGDELSYRVVSKDSNGNYVDLADQIEVYASNHRKTLWDKWFGNSLFDEGDYENIKSIQVVNSSDLLTDSGILKSESFSDKYYISERDIAFLASFATSSELKGKTTYLMRFAVEDYYFRDVSFYDKSQTDFIPDAEAKYFEKVIYKNLDILSFTFENEYSERVVLPVAASPIDNVGEITPTLKPTNKFQDALNNLSDFWSKLVDLGDLLASFKLIALIVAGIFVIVLLNWLLKLLGLSLPGIVKGIGNVIAAPFKAVGKLFDTGEKVASSKRKADEHKWKKEDRNKKEDRSKNEDSNKKDDDSE